VRVPEKGRNPVCHLTLRGFNVDTPNVSGLLLD